MNDSDPPGTYYLYENNDILAKERSKDNILFSWKASHKKQPNKYHEVRFEPDVPVLGMPRRWDYCQLKPGDDLRGVPCCECPILEYLIWAPTHGNVPNAVNYGLSKELFHLRGIRKSEKILNAVKLIDSIREKWNHRTRLIGVDERGLKIYKCWCVIHKEFYEAYPAGYNAILHCPKCLAERSREW